VTGGHRVRAELVLAATDDGGLRAALPSGTRSLVLRFASLEHSDGLLSLGAVITVSDGEALVPSTACEVELQFWADEARIYATPGVPFDLWYGRAVGKGVVLSPVEDVK
jgi:hypothetical protein